MKHKIETDFLKQKENSFANKISLPLNTFQLNGKLSGGPIRSSNSRILGQYRVYRVDRFDTGFLLWDFFFEQEE